METKIKFEEFRKKANIGTKCIINADGVLIEAKIIGIKDRFVECKISTGEILTRERFSIFPENFKKFLKMKFYKY